MANDTTQAAGAVVACRACGEANPARAKFCLECGAPLRAREVAPSEARKTVTVLFSDLVGSTALQAALDPESVRNVMGRFYAAMSGALEQHGGHAEKFVGDAVMAVFGAPVVREDDAVRAVRAADAMRVALQTLNVELQERWGVQLGMRTGLNTGEVVASQEGFVVGDAVNVAARLEQAAAAGEVLVGETTWRLARHEASFEAAAALTVKGKDAPLPVYRLLAATPAADDRGRLEAPLIGREEELARLHAALAVALDERACRLVTIVGSPGMGKTRLAREFAVAVGEQATVVEGRCEPSGEGITFLPVAEVLRDAAGIGEADAAEDVRTKLGLLVPDDPDRDLLVERAAGVLGVAQVTGTEETFWSVRRLLGGLARMRPLVVLLDDVHWGQPTFLDLLEHLVEWGRESPILLVAMARPELRDTRPSLTDTGRLASDVIELSPLAPESSRRLAAEMLDSTELPAALAERVLQTTDGNPLFLGETLRMLVDDGVLRRDGERWVAVGDAAGAEVPPTITALLAARIARLGADERSVVERAAVIGKQFYRGAVAELASTAVAAGIDGHLEALRRKEVVEPDGTVWFDEPVFRFHHVLIRDAAYRALLKAARADLHERFADWLQTKTGELVGEHEEVIAFHLEQAYDYRRQLGPLDESGHALGARAVERLHSAGRRALAREDLPAATNLLARASAVAEGDRAGDVLVDLLEALLSAGDTTEAARVLDLLRSACGDDLRLGAWAVVTGAQLAQMTDSAHLATTVDEVAATLDAFAAAGDDAGLAKAQHVRAQGLALLGQVGEVEATLDKALAAARRAGDARRVTAVLAGAPRAALWGPSPVMRASGRCLDVVRILRMSQGNRHVEAVALRCQAVLEAWRGRPEAARQILDHCRLTLEELGLGLELLETDVHAGIVELAAADLPAAETRLRAAYDGFLARGLDVGAATAAALLGRAVLEQGRDDEAEELTRFCERHGGESLKTTIAWCGLRAQVLARRSEHDEAEALARRAADAAAATDALVDHGDARMALAEVLRAAGREDDAVAEALRARQLYEAKGHETGAERAAAFADERRAASRARTPGALPAGIESEMTQDIRTLADTFVRRDWDALRDCLCDDIATLDRRPNSPRGDTSGADRHLAGLQAYVDAADDVQLPWTLLVQAGDLGIAHFVFHGHQNDTGSEFAIPILTVLRLDHHRVAHMELFNPEDERAAHAALLALQPDPGLRAAWRHMLDYVAAMHEGDHSALAECFAEDVVLHDHRLVIWAEQRGRAAVTERVRLAVEMAEDLRISARVLRASAEALMFHVHGEGRWAGGAEATIDCVHVVALRDGVGVRLEQFDPEDTDAMRTSFERPHDAAAGAPLVSLSAPRAVMDTPWRRSVDALCDAANRRDWTAFADLLAPGFYATDHRTLTVLPEAQAATGWISYAQGMPALASDARMTITQFAGDNRQGAAHGQWQGHQNEGGGEFVFAVMVVLTVDDDGIDRFEYFDPDDARGAAERLLGLQDDPVTRAAWRAQLELLLAFNARDWTALRACCAGDVATADALRSRLVAIPDGRCAVRFLTAGPRQATGRLHVYGHARDGSEAEATVTLALTLRDGAVTGIELADAGAAPGEALVTGWQPEVLAFTAGALNGRDWERAAELLSDDFRLADHRPLPLFDFAEGERWLEAIRTMVDLASDAVVGGLQVAGDAAHGVWRIGWKGHDDAGGGEFTLPFIIVLRSREGRLNRAEYVDFDDPRAAFDVLEGLQDDPGLRARWRPLLDVVVALNTRDWAALEGSCSAEAARRARALVESVPAGHVAIELDGGEGRLRVHRTRASGFLEPAEAHELTITARDGVVAFVERAGAMRAVIDRFVGCINGRDFAGAKGCFVPDFVMVDHRPVSPLGKPEPGREAHIARLRAMVAVASDVQLSVEYVAEAEAAWLGRFAWGGHMDDGGGAFETPFLAVGLVDRERVARLELFPLEDEPAARRRLDDLAAGAATNLIAAITARHCAAFNARDWPRVAEEFAEDYTLVDHRLATGWPTISGRAQFLAMWRDLLTMSPDETMHSELIEGDDEVAILRYTGRGHAAEGGGEFEIPTTVVAVARAGLLMRSDVHEPDADPATLRARAEHLRPLARRRAGVDLPLEPLAVEGSVMRLFHALENAGDTGTWGAVHALGTPDMRIVDHRPASTFGDEVRDMDAFVALQQALAASSYAVTRRHELVAASELRTAGIHTARGRLVDGDGDFELSNCLIIEWRDDGVAWRAEFFAADDEAGMLARFAELDQAADPPPTAGV